MTFSSWRMKRNAELRTLLNWADHSCECQRNLLPKYMKIKVRHEPLLVDPQCVHLIVGKEAPRNKQHRNGVHRLPSPKLGRCRSAHQSAMVRDQMKHCIFKIERLDQFAEISVDHKLEMSIRSVIVLGVNHHEVRQRAVVLRLHRVHGVNDEVCPRLSAPILDIAAVEGEDVVR